MEFKNIRLIGIFVAVGCLLLIPFIAMRFTGEVKWTAMDFIAGGTLLLAAGLAIEFVVRKVRTAPSRIAFCGVILAALVLVWGELATGFFRSKITGVPPAESQAR